jgi:D-hexose-6-phosphate mutarotase
VIGSKASQMGVGYQMDMEKMMQVELTDELKQKTVVNAFSALQTYYKYEAGEWVFVGA